MNEQGFVLTFEHVPTTPLIPERLSTYAGLISEVIAKKSGPYEKGEDALRLPQDPSVLADVTHMVQRYWNTQLRYVIVVGVGGSNLGAKAVYDALRGTLDGLLDGFPKLIFLDTVSPKLLGDLVRLLEVDVSYKEEIVVNLISKSGSTTESVANFEMLHAYLLKRFPTINDRIVVTTEKDSPLWNIAEKHKFGVLLHQHVGGRFSVFSSVGLLPLGLVGIDISSFTEGGKETLRQCLLGNDQAMRFATALYRATKHEVTTVNFFFFNPELESLGKWSRQLYGESLGKEHDKSGNLVHEGITPIVSIGSTDLHSMAQLYLGGPRDKFTLLMHVKEATHMRVPASLIFKNVISGINGKQPVELMDAIYQGVRSAYGKHKLPFAEVGFHAINPYTLGMFLSWQMLSVVYLAELLHVNAFDQPNVEDYKKVTKQILESSK